MKFQQLCKQKIARLLVAIAFFAALPVAPTPARADVAECLLVATGGVVSSFDDGAGVTYCVHSFAGDGQFTVLNEPLDADYLIVGGGGGAGTGGGGAGGFFEGSTSLGQGSYPVIVGIGGIGSTSLTTPGGNGGDSIAFGITAGGGGGGGRGEGGSGAGRNGSCDGGSGGGASKTNQSFPGGTGCAPGFDGFSNTSNDTRGGGGGGAGGDASFASGGDGRSSTITGSQVFYAGGGRATTDGSASNGDGQDGPGGGGEGGNFPGKDGIVIVQYAVATITFDSDGGSPVDPITQNPGSSVTAPADPTRTGYAFAGWDPAVPATMPLQDLAVTAQWDANTYTVNFDANGGTGSMAPQGFTYDVPQALNANAFTRPGFAFEGWNTESDGSGTAFADGAVVDNLTAEPDGTVTLYADWAAFDLTAGGSSIVADPVSIVADGTSTSAVTVSLVDANDNPVTGASVVIATDAGTIGAVSDNGDGTYSAVLTSGVTAGL
ncbi:hypothetical protein HMH01_17660, partial [Halovulum dunhuangense]